MPLPVLSVAEMRSWENATWAAGRTPAEVITQVGELLAGRLGELVPAGSRIVLLAGKGHNGDDVRACAKHLDEFQVQLIDCRDPASGLAKWQQLGGYPDLIVDGLFGIGLSRPLAEDWLQLIEAINQSPAPIVAVDVPSGLDADTGRALGGVIRAAMTLTLGAPKRGLLTTEAVDCVGRLEVIEDIGLVPLREAIAAPTGDLLWSASRDYLSFPRRRTAASHKGNYGHVGVIAGSPGYHGAAVLAARGAQRSEAGLVTVMTPEDVYLPIASQLQSAMVRTWESSASLPDNLTALLVGPGLASPKIPSSLKLAITELWASAPIPVGADASALDMIRETRVPALRVITPHPGEASRLLGVNISDVQADRAGAVRRLSERFGGCWVVLKGHQTLVGRNTGPILVNSSGNPGLAQGGSGDLLGGFIAGLLGQKRHREEFGKAIAYAVWEHGAAADRLARRQPRWSIEELAAELGQWNGKTLPPAGPIC